MFLVLTFSDKCSPRYAESQITPILCRRQSSRTASEARISITRGKTPTLITWIIAFLSCHVLTPGLATRMQGAHVTSTGLHASGCVVARNHAEGGIRVVLAVPGTIVSAFRISGVCAGALIESVIRGSVERVASSRSWIR